MNTSNVVVLRAILGTGLLALLAACGADDGSFVPATPSGLVSLEPEATDGQLNLVWSESSGASSYQVKRSTINGGPYTPFAVSTSTSVTDSALNEGTTYYYVVSAANAQGESMDSPQMSAMAQAASAPPREPGDPTATAGNAQIGLVWGTSSGATSYKVKRSDDSGGSYHQVAMPTSASYVDTGLTNGRVYYYVVTAVNSAGESGNSGLAGATPSGSASAPAAPAAPSSLAATAGDARVSLSWSASNGATSYNVKRSTSNGGPYTQIAGLSSTGYTDSPLANGTTQYYVVTALNAAGESVQSTQASATPAAAAAAPPAPAAAPAAQASAPPAAPANLQATTGNAQISLNWSASSGATGYKVKRSDDSGGSYRLVASPAGTSHVDTGLTNGRVYYYVVTATNSAGESGNSGLVGGVPQGSASAPSAPSNVMATAGNSQVKLSWIASNGATSYKVKRATTSGGSYTQIATPTSTSYTNTALSNGTTYYYVISAVNSAGESGNSSQVNATPVAAATAPAAPGNLSATAGNAQVTLSWSASSSATSYNVKRATTSGGAYTQVGSTASTSFTNTSLANGTTYYYVVTAVNSAGESGNSGQANATPTSGSVVSYSTAFDGTESPVSEGGRWQQNNPWFTKVVTQGGIAYGTTPNPAPDGQYMDSYSILKGMNFPANQYASAHIYKGPNTSGYMEVELLLRASDTGNSTQAYECYLQQDGAYVTVTRWSGRPMNAPAGWSYFDELGRRESVTAPRDGDLFEAQIVGNIITVKLAGATVITVDVSQFDGQVLANGQPGMAFNIGHSGTEGPNNQFGFRDFSAKGL